MNAAASPHGPADGSRPLLSVCVPSYNRARFLSPLLASVQAQFDVLDPSDRVAAADRFEVIVCEDASPERDSIRAVVEDWTPRLACPLRWHENSNNLGYDGNLRQLVALARGRWCVFVGNDDLLAPRALKTLMAALRANPDAGVVLRGYAPFRGSPDNVVDTVRYVDRPTRLAAGADAIATVFRRSGVISGYTVDRDAAEAAATCLFDGTLYYQLHLSASVLAQRPALLLPDILVLCRDLTPPDFGAAASEHGRYEPGRYTPQARVAMVEGAMAILQAHVAALPSDAARTLHRRVVRDYARHFYPFVMDQLGLPPREYVAMCLAMARTPVGRMPSFWINCAVAYMLGRRRADALIGAVRRQLGRTPHL